MRPLIDRVVPQLEAPKDSLLDEARCAAPQQDTHRDFIRRIPALQAVEQGSPAPARPWPGLLRVAAFNAERLKNRPAVRNLMRRAGAQVTLLSEVDLGMARSGNTHNIRDLIGESGEGYLYGVEFVELDLGSVDEIELCAGQSNARGLHGNAIVTGLALERPHLIPLEENGLWFPGINGAERRIG